MRKYFKDNFGLVITINYIFNNNNERHNLSFAENWRHKQILVLLFNFAAYLKYLVLKESRRANFNPVNGKNLHVRIVLFLFIELSFESHKTIRRFMFVWPL